MKRFLRRIFPLLMVVVIVLSIGWFLFKFDPQFTRNLLLQQARRFENNGNHSAAVWCYDMAYRQLDGSDDVAIEMAQQFKDIGNYSKAEYTLQKALKDGSTVDLYVALSKIYVEQGKLRDAVLLLDNAEPKLQEQLSALRPAAPTVSLEPGSYNQYLSVELTCDSGTIYVSTDGDHPSAKNDAYTGPIRLTAGETTMIAVCVGDNGLVSSIAVYSYIVSDVVETVTFVDPAFESAVRTLLELPEDHVIYSDTLWEITEMTLPADVRSCADLKWLPNLQKLTIVDASMDSLDTLVDLEHLQELNIRGSILNSDMLDAIGCVTSLQRLTLSNCAISSIAALSDLTQLQYLDLSDNAIRDLSSLSAMTQLQYLDLHSNALINLSGLEGLTKVAYLDVSYNSLTSIQAVENMAELTYLNLSSNTLRSLEGVEKLTRITSFIAQHNELLDVDALRNCRNLVYLDVSHNTLLNLNVTVSLYSLRELYFDHNEVTQLPKYSINCALTTISGCYNRISSLSNLAGLRALSYVYMDYNTNITSVNSLANCPELKEVFVYGTNVKSVSVLTEKGIYVVYSPA